MYCIREFRTEDVRTSWPKSFARSSPWNSWPRCGLTERNSYAVHPAPAWKGICPTSGLSLFPPWRLLGSPAVSGTGSVCAGSGSRQACCGLSYWQYCRKEERVGLITFSSNRKQLHPCPEVEHYPQISPLAQQTNLASWSNAPAATLGTYVPSKMRLQTVITFQRQRWLRQPASALLHPLFNSADHRRMPARMNSFSPVGSETLKWWSELRKPERALKNEGAVSTFSIQSHRVPPLFYFSKCNYSQQDAQKWNCVFMKHSIKEHQKGWGMGRGLTMTDNAVMISCIKSSFPTAARAGHEDVLL